MRRYTHNEPIVFRLHSSTNLTEPMATDRRPPSTANVIVGAILWALSIAVAIGLITMIGPDEREPRPHFSYQPGANK